MGNKNLNFTSGSLSKVENSSRVFNKVFQNYTQSAQTGILSIKFPQASTAATMFDVTIKIYNYQSTYLGTIRVSFYKQTATVIHSTGRKGLIECTDNFPSTIVNVGMDLSGNVCINLGDINTVWNLHTNIEIERVLANYTGHNVDWSKGWSQTVETVAPVVPTTYQSLVSIPTEVLSTRSWVTSQIPSAQNLSTNATTAGTIDISGGGTSTNLQSLLPLSKADGNIRSLRMEMQPYFTSAGSVNYPSQIGTGIRLERYSSVSDQRGFNIWSAGVSNEIYFKTFNGTSNESAWQMVASREWSATKYVPLNFNEAVASATFSGDCLAMPLGSYLATVSSAATNLPFTNPGGLISVGQIGSVSTRILGARDNSDNLWFQSGVGTSAWRQLASREWSTANLALTNHTHPFASITSKPTTAAGYGITDVPRQGVFGGDINSIRSNDTRNTNPLPSTDLKSGVWFDFKNSAAIGLTAPNTSTYSASMTFVPYGDDSGNSVVAFRLSHSNSRLFYQSYNAGAWNNGKYLWTSSDFSQTDINNWNTAFNWGNHASAGYLTNSALSNYYTKNESLNLFVKNNGVETISDTKTFTHSPVIPAGTLGTHAVNVNQLSTKADGQENATAVGFSSGNIPTTDGNSFPYMYHNSGLYVALATQSYLQTNFLSTPNGTSVIISGANLNNYLKTGFYRGSGLTNAPLNNGGWWYVVIETHDSTWVTQKATSFGSGNTPNITYQRTMTGGSWSAWAQIWTTQDFTVSSIQQWNYMAQYGLQLNSDFTVNTGSGLVIADDYFGEESGIIDNKEGRLVAAKRKDYYFYGSKYDEFDGLNFHWERKLFGMGREANDTDKLTVEGSIKASKNFKSEDEKPDTIFIPNGQLATLRDEIINDKDYAIRLDPHEYEIGSSGYLEVDDRNRLIHIIGEQVKMVVNFRKIYPKQQIVIYNFDKSGGTMAVQVQGKTIYNINPGCFLRLYVTKSLRVIAERQQPSEIVW
jgi:hypothetical protein